MKISVILLLLSLQTFAIGGLAQKVTLDVKNEKLSRVFKSIEQQTGYRFTYSNQVVPAAKEVTLKVQNEDLGNVLNILLKDLQLDYREEAGKIIIIFQKNQTADTQTLWTPIDVHGRVINEKDEPVVGATVKIKGTEIGTSTNDNGEFTLNVLRPDMILVITGTNIEPMEIAVNARTNLIINAKTRINQLDETIIKGYYSTSRRLNTGSVNKVSAADIGNQPVSNPLASLEGRVPGLFIKQANGLPGSNFTVRIRGQNSIQSGSSPLYIIDGVPFLNDADVLTQRSGINASSPFNTINPADIESIEILKDADATSIYGSRGANGVIIITTKKGKVGKTKINASIYSGWGKVTGTMNFLNTSQYLEMRHEAFLNDIETPDPSNAYDLLIWDTTRYTDLKKQLIGGTAHSDNFELQLSGGNANTNFSVGGNYYKETTVFPGNNSDRRGSCRLSISHHSDDNKLGVQIVSSYASDVNDLIRQDLTQFISLPPDIPELYDSLGNLNWSKDGFSFGNPLANVLRKYKVITDRLTADIITEYRLSSQLKLKLNLGYNQILTNESDRIPINSQDPSFLPTGYSFFGTNHVKSWIMEPQVDYDFKIAKKLKVQTLLGTTWQANTGDQTAITATGYTNDNLLGSTTGAQTLTTKNGQQLYHYNAFFGRINLNWLDKYLINLTGRRDGSSRFGPGKQFANFGAFGIGWIFSKESFIARSFPFLSFGKLRLSYGITGNDLIGNYNYIDAYSATQYPYQGVSSLFPTKLFNSDYSWEQIQKSDAGLELGLFNDRISFSFDWFRNKSRNQIINYLLPGQTGFSYVLQNFPGIVENSGYEVQVSSENIRAKNFLWSTTLNFTTAKNKLVSFPGLETSSYSFRYIIGKPLNAYIGPLYAGVDPATGVYQFFDINHQLTFSPSFSDYVYVGTTDPKFYGGVQNNISLKNWELTFLFEYRKQKGIDPIFSTDAIVGDINNQPVAVLDRWRKPGDITKYEQFTQTYNMAGSAVDPLSASDAILTDASYIRLKTLSLSYSLPKAVLSKAHLDEVRFYIEAQDLLTISAYKGFDPETQSIRSLPPIKMFVCGVQIIF